MAVFPGSTLAPDSNGHRVPTIGGDVSIILHPADTRDMISTQVDRVRRFPTSPHAISNDFECLTVELRRDAGVIGVARKFFSDRCV